MTDKPAPTPEQIEANLGALRSCEYGPAGTGGNQYCLHCGRGIFGHTLEDAIVSTAQKYRLVYACEERFIRKAHDL